MATSDEVYRQLDRAEQTMRQAESRLGDFAALRPVLAELVGTADGAEGRVHVAWSPQGLSRLEIEPRAMRLPSEDLAAEISSAIGAAIADLREKTRAALTAAGLATGAPYSTDEVRSALAKARENTMDGARRAVSDLDRATDVGRRGAW